MSSSENIDALLEMYNITQEELASIAGVTPGAVTGWRHGSRPRKEAVRNICSHFGLDEDSLLSDTHGLAERSELPDGCCAKHSQIYAIPSSTARVAVSSTALGWRKPGEDAGGKPLTIDIPKGIVAKHPNAYAMKVFDESMSRVLPLDAFIIVDPDNIDPDNGSIVVVEILDLEELRLLMGTGSPVILRTWFRGAAKVMLSPNCYHTGIDDIIVNIEDLDNTMKVLGTVIWYQPISMMA